MNRDDFVGFPNSDTGIRIDRIISWLPGENTVNDANGDPVRELVFTVWNSEQPDDYAITIRNPADIKRFLAGLWTQGMLVQMLVKTCEQALSYIDAEYNDGGVDDDRPRWGDCQELDDLHNQLGRMIALATGTPFTPRE